jgi:DNA repair exonuclease SbcCD ATPase subunit
LNISDLLDRSVPLLRRHLEGRVSALEAKIEELKAPADVNEAIKEITQQYSFADLGDFISTMRDNAGSLVSNIDEVDRKRENLSNRVASNRLRFDQAQEAVQKQINILNERVEGLQKGLSENINSEIYRIVKAEINRLEATFSQKLQQNQSYNEEQRNATSKTLHSTLNDHITRVNESKPISIVEVRQIAKEEAERVKPSASAPAPSGTAPANAEARLAALEAWATNTGNMLGIPFKKA